MEPKEEELIARAQEGDSNAFGRLYRRYFKKIYYYIYRLSNCSEDAEDIASIVFLKALVGIKQYESRGRFLAWLRKIAFNSISNFYKSRRSRKRREAVFLGPPTVASVAEARLVEMEEMEALATAIEGLPPDYQSVLALKLAGLTNMEIGEVIGRSVSAVKSLYHKTLKALRRDVRQQGFG